jgi:hypothetical protein
MWGLVRVAVLVALAAVGGSDAKAVDEQSFLSLIASYEKSQNSRDIALLQSVVAPEVSVWLPSGQGDPLIGSAAAVKFFVGFFASFQSISEAVSQRIVTNSSAAIAKFFNAVAANGCAISVPVIQNFVSHDGVSLSAIHGVWNTTLFNEQFGCHKK